MAVCAITPHSHPCRGTVATLGPSSVTAAAAAQAAFGAVTIRTSQNIFEGSTGCHEWDAGFALAEALLSRPELVRGKRCLELGSVRFAQLLRAPDPALRRLLV